MEGRKFQRGFAGVRTVGHKSSRCVGETGRRSGQSHRVLKRKHLPSPAAGSTPREALPAGQADLDSQRAPVDTRLVSPRRVARLVSGEPRVARPRLEVLGRMPVRMDGLSLAQGHEDPAMQPSSP